MKTDKGIEEVIKTLDVKLSEAIMHAMENGPELEKKVSEHLFYINSPSPIQLVYEKKKKNIAHKSN